MQQLSLWTLFAEDSHAKTSQALAKAKASSMVTGQVFGGKCTDLSITYSQELQCWKTCQPCCGKTEACTLSCKTWPKSGMMQNGALYQQDNLVHPICEKEFLSLPTPAASAIGGNLTQKYYMTKNGTPRTIRNSSGQTGTPTLEPYIKIMIQEQRLPTPCQSDADKMGNNSLIRLIETGNRYAPSHKRYKPNLNTPTVNTSKQNPQTLSQWKRQGSLNVDAAKMMGYNKESIQTTGKNFRLNPHFVTEMMGFPIDWLD